jgi:Fic family protein
MRPEEFSPTSSGELISIGKSTWAFVPAPLPPALTWDANLVQALSSATLALGELAGLGRNLPNPYVFTQPFLNREAVLSSRIEGTQASLTDLYALEAQAPLFPLPERTSDAKEVRNYVRALEHGLRRLNELPISLRLLREMHAVLMEGVRGESRAPGEFRRVQNWIGPPGAALENATYVPPPPGDALMHGLDAFERFIHSDIVLPPLVKTALVHYQFEALHPFLDGNGRIGRLLIILMLIEANIIPQPLLYLSAYFERYRADYYRLLLEVSQQGAWRDWLLFFLRGVEVEAQDAALRAKRILDLREGYRERYQREAASANLLAALDQLFVRPITTISQLSTVLNMSFRGAAKIVERLEQDGLLEEATGRKRDRVYIARHILELLEQPILEPR